ncbi:MAG TPA: MurT ligase domain-containing protein, partial [Thermomicrobiales bacterium]|nr:MurT ligase domain-containing protein [Thermomicrobiales bacterium]
DQLDRYGELNAIATSWRTALERLPAATRIVVNADDPTLTAITDGLAARRVAFGLDDPASEYRLPALPHAVDAAICRRCGHDLTYDTIYSAHLGAWRCPRCGQARPSLDVCCRDIQLDGVEALRATIERAGNGAALPVAVAVPGLYNVYNTTAAVAAAATFGISDSAIGQALAAFRSPFGRVERVALRHRTIVMALVKNPVGFNETLRMLTAGGELAVPTLIAINDLAADGRDVSWLWDVDFELLADGAAPLFTTGLRGADMANRLKYAGVEPERLHALDSNLAHGLDAFIEGLPDGALGYVLPTYTAMLGLRRILADRGAVDSFWRQ